MTPDWLSAVFLMLALIGAGFCLGVAFAIYRAVTWVDRMRSWAASVEKEEVTTP